MAKRSFFSTPLPAKAIAIVAISLWVLIGVFPIYWALITSLKPATSVASIPPEILPTSLSLANWAELFTGTQAIRWTFNSLLVSVVTAVSSVVLSLMAGYAFAKLRFRGHGVLFSLVIGMLMFSSQVLMVPQFIIMQRLGLLDTYWALILPMLVTPFGVFLTKQFIQTIPSEIFEAARLDGCSEFGLVFRVAAPLARPALGMVGVFAFLTSWSEYIYPLVMTSSGEMRTLTVGLSLLQSEYSLNYGLLMAGAVLVAAPPFVLFLILQRQFVEGLTMGAAK